MAVDYFSCSCEPKIDLAIQYLKDVLEAKTSDEVEINRGDMHIKKTYSVPVSMVSVDEMAV